MRKKDLKKGAAILLAAVYIIPGSIYAQEKQLTRSAEFQTQNEEFQYDFEPEIRVDGKTYKLTNTEYQVLNSKVLNTEPDHKVELKDLLTKEDAEKKLEKELTVTINGKPEKVQLKEIKYKDTKIKSRTQSVSYTVDYDLDTERPNIAGERAVSYTDDLTGETYTETFPLIATDMLQDWHWAADVTVPMTVRVYDAAYYRIGNAYFEKNDSTPALKGKESQVLAEIGLSPDTYKITGYNWSGGVYENNGVQYRNITVSMQRYVSQYRAVYGGTATLPEVNGFEATGEYHIKDKTPLTEYTVQAMAQYELQQGIPWVQIGIGLAALLLAALIVFIIVFLRKKRKNT